MSSADPVLHLSDLTQWPAGGTWLAVLGHPIAHSVSPAMHNASLARLAATKPRFADWRYTKFDIAPEHLAEALKALHVAGFKGLNLTVPHKVLALPLIARVDPAAAAIGAVNTLRATETGWEGFNTDGHGMAEGIARDLGLGLPGADVILLGAGGAARAAAVECLQRGVRSLSIANRTEANLTQLLSDLAPLCRAGTHLRGFSPANIPADLPAGAILINSTSAGLKTTDPLPIALSELPRPAAVYDMIYNPARTELLRLAATAGIPVSNGLSMLVNQGARALSLWTGAPETDLVGEMNSAAHKAMSR